MPGAEREYQRLLERYRRRRTRKELGLEPASLPFGRGGRGSERVRQVDVDTALQGGAGTYQKIRAGRLRPSPDFYMRLAQLLGFSPEDTAIGHLELFRTEPVLPPAAPSPFLRRLIGGQREIACAITPDGRRVASNGAFAALFPGGEPPANLWRWMLSPDAERLLLDWEQAWAPRLLTEIRLMHYRTPQDGAALRLLSEVADDARLRSVEETGSGLGGAALPLRHPALGDGTAHLLTSRTTGASILNIFFEPGE
ncbi:helix-turn-helix domain-containing protein [Streptomyces sp. VB1]|uniref:MmyB family transcriptional regulator n=1 Tax=Streptomyces sp. VB1 TaxID=2986803 RepID=UPI0022423B6A|nr:helix-turn-helix domain-containing protein [Streptomyces sp. VB1]UZI33999.1 helix-turn-helix domain-containing protein [Streptomyces sp. VB1]